MCVCMCVCVCVCVCVYDFDLIQFISLYICIYMYVCITRETRHTWQLCGIIGVSGNKNKQVIIGA